MNSAASDLRLFGLGASRPLAADVADVLGIRLSPHEEREFEDGEHKARPLEGVRGSDVYVIHSLCGDAAQGVDGRLCRMLFFLATLRDHGAGRVTAIAPYLCYARKDRRTKAHDPLTLRYVAQLFEAVGVDQFVALDTHNPAAFENAFRCRTLNVEAMPLFVAELAVALRDRPVTVLSPDAGGYKRADALRRALADVLPLPVELGLMAKRRSGGEVSGETLFADVADRDVVIVDDLVSSGTTLLRAGRAARAAGALHVLGVATHGLFAPGADAILVGDVFDRLLFTDSIQPPRIREGEGTGRLRLVSCAQLLADTVRYLHAGRRGLEAAR